ncbi:MAG: leucyl-tRNA synthetase, partial [Actinomycetota bacterium]|nr:leucyl-tRNA synthetase [Actinomycetota bacterium]
ERGVAAEPADEWPEAYVGDGVAMASTNSQVSLDGLATPEAKKRIGEWLERTGFGAPTITYKLRDWLFSRQRYWGEPFPIVYGADDRPLAVPDSMLPVELPDVVDFEPRVSDDPDALPEPPLSRAEQWVVVELDLGDGPRIYRRETNTMPQWAGSCWYYLRYLDPTNEDAMVDPQVERYWATGTSGDGPAAGIVDLYVGGVEHAVLHLLYARFWHKVLFDLGHVSTVEPFQRLFNQGYVLAPAYVDGRGVYVDASQVEEHDGAFTYQGEPVRRESGKMGKSLKNSVTPDDICAEYGADTLRLYEMFMGPLDASRLWNTSDIIGVHRYLQRLWRNVVDENTGGAHVSDEPADDDTRRMLHRTIAAVRADMTALRFNTAIARLTELNNRLTTVVASAGRAPREVVEPLVLMTAPLAPHIAEELWSLAGHPATLAYESFPEADAAWLLADQVEIGVQVDGKVRARVMVPADADEAAYEAEARAEPRVATLLADKPARKVIVVPGRLVNFIR